MDKKDKNNYIVLFKGIKLSKREANKVGLAIIFGFVGILMSIFITGGRNRALDLLIIFTFAGIGYFLGSRFFKKT